MSRHLTTGEQIYLYQIPLQTRIFIWQRFLSKAHASAVRSTSDRMRITSNLAICTQILSNVYTIVNPEA